MSSSQNKTSKSEQQSRSVSINDIIRLVDTFEYSIDSKIVDENHGNSKSKKPSSQVQIQKENLAKLLKTIIQIKSAVVNEPRTLKDRINKLYESLKSKLENDLYLLNVKVLVKFLQGYQSTHPDRLNTSIRLFFDALLEDVDKELKNLLNDTDFNLLANIFIDNKIEQNLPQIIRSALRANINKEDKDRSTRILSFIYIYLVLNNRSRYNFNNQLFRVEHVFAEHLLEFQLGDKSKYLHKYLPEALTSSNPKTKIKSSIYIYLTAKNNELIEEMKSLNDQLTESRNTVSKLSSDRTQLKAEGKEKDNEIVKLKEEEEEKDKEIAKLKDELTDTTQSLTYEIRDLKRQLDVTKTGLVINIKKRTKLALEDLTIIASRLPQNQGAELSDWVKHLEGYFDSLAE